MYLNVFSYWRYLQKYILKIKRYTIQQYKRSFLQSSYVDTKVTSLL